MSTHPNRTLDELWTDLPVGTPPLSDMVHNGTARRRRRRLAATGAAGALTLAVIAAATVAGTTLGRGDAGDRDPSLVASTPTAPAGSRLVGMGRVVVAAPNDWALNAVNQCGLPNADTIWFPQDSALACDIVHPVAAVKFSPLDSGDGEIARRQATDETVVDGTRVLTGAFECSPDSICVVPDAMFIVVPEHRVAITLTGQPEDRAALEEVAASVQILDEGWTTVPYVENGTFPEWGTALTDAGLVPDVTDAPCGVHARCLERREQIVVATVPAAGEVAAAGTTVEVYGPGTSPRDAPASE